MYCPFKFNNPNLVDKECEGAYCQAWDQKSKFNYETKEYEGDCRLCSADRKVSGMIITR